MTREPIYAALFQQFSALAGNAPLLFRTATRRLDTWEGVSSDDQPALLMRQFKEQPTRVTGQPTKWQLDVRILIYAHTGAGSDKAVVAAQILNPLLDAVDVALRIDDQERRTCTLGGLVYSCAVDGEVEIHLGNMGDEAVAIVPVRIVVVDLTT